jgi:Cdc6-like AAA superfamily ATPase
MGDLVFACEKLSCLISRGAVYERLYQPRTIPKDIIANLHHALIGLYAAVLRMIALCHGLFLKNTAKRALHAFFHPGDVKAELGECEKLEAQVEYEANNCERARSQEEDEESKKLLHILQQPILRTDKNVLSLLEKVGEKEQLEVLDWLSKVLYGKHHKTVKERRTANTCGWLLDHSRYQEWQQASGSIVLWLCGTGEIKFANSAWILTYHSFGLAGTGKTFLTSSVIDEIQAGLRGSPNQEGFAFFYCNRNETERQEPLSMLRAFVRQLSTINHQSHSIQKCIKDYYNECRLKASEPTMGDCKEILLELVNIYPRTTLVVDALDECEKHKRLELIETIDHLLAEASNPVKIFISSRPDGDIKERSKDRANIEINATDNHDDISKFVNSEIVKHRKWTTMPVKLKTQIVETLQQQSQGM